MREIKNPYLESVPEVNPAVVDEVGLRVEHIVANEAMSIFSNDTGHVVLGAHFFQIFERLTAGRVQARGRGHFSQRLVV